MSFDWKMRRNLRVFGRKEGLKDEIVRFVEEIGRSLCDLYYLYLL